MIAMYTARKRVIPPATKNTRRVARPSAAEEERVGKVSSTGMAAIAATAGRAARRTRKADVLLPRRANLRAAEHRERGGQL